MTPDYSDLIQGFGLIAILLILAFLFSIAFDYFSDGEISCSSYNIKEVEKNNFQFTVRCYPK